MQNAKTFIIDQAKFAHYLHPSVIVTKIVVKMALLYFVNSNFV